MCTLLTKPHFFKPLLPGFHDEFLIPIAFVKYLNKGHECEEAQATLRSRQCGKLWPVKINGRRFGLGWKQFVQDHDLHIADFLVFRYDGDLVFFVLIFDRTTCERLYPPLPATDHEVESIQIQEQNLLPITDYAGKNFEEKKKVKCRLEEKPRSSLEHPYCVLKLTPDCFKSSRLHIPWKFAREHGLYGRCCSMILKDENGSCWPAKLLYKSSNGKSFVAGGWTAFHVAHELKAGDLLIVEPTRNGWIPALKMRRLQEHPEIKKEVVYQNNAQATSSSTGHLPSTAEPSDDEESELSIPEEEANKSGSWKWKKHKQPNTVSEAKASSCVVQQCFFVAKLESNTSKLYIPENFARLQHLQNKTYSKVILIDRERRRWLVNLCHRGDLVYIGNISDEFRIANKLKPRDPFVLECIETGNMLAFKMYVFKTNHKDVKNLEADSSTCLYLTVLASHVRNCQMGIPRGFARRNCLDTSTSSEMTITNETGNSWQVTVKVDKSGGAFIRNGWTKFAQENGIKVGDVLMFELIKGGTTLLMKYYAVKPEIDSNEKVMWEDLEDAY